MRIALMTLAGSSLLAMSCKGKVKTADIEAQVRTFAASAGDVTTVKCKDLDAKVDAESSCTVSFGAGPARELSVKVTALESKEAKFNMQFTPDLVNVRKLETDFVGIYAKQRFFLEKITCAGNVLQVKGEKFACSATTKRKQTVELDGEVNEKLEVYLKAKTELFDLAIVSKNAGDWANQQLKSTGAVVDCGDEMAPRPTSSLACKGKLADKTFDLAVAPDGSMTWVGNPPM